MGFQNIIKLLKSDEQKLNYSCLKLKPLHCNNNKRWSVIDLDSPIQWLGTYAGLVGPQITLLGLW